MKSTETMHTKKGIIYRDASALCWRPERRLPLFHSGVVFLSFSHPCLVSVLSLFVGFVN